MFQHTKLYLFFSKNLSLGFILKIFLKFRKFQPRYSYKIYSYKKKKSVILMWNNNDEDYDHVDAGNQERDELGKKLYSITTPLGPTFAG